MKQPFLLLICTLFCFASASIWTNVLETPPAESRVSHALVAYVDPSTQDTLFVTHGGNRCANDSIQYDPNMCLRRKDIQAYSMKNQTWTLLSEPSVDGSYTWIPPAARTHHGCAIVPHNNPYFANCMFMIGGETDWDGSFLMAFNLTDNEWVIPVSPNWNVDPGDYSVRNMPAFQYSKLDFSLVLFGGGKVRDNSHTYKFYFSSETWVRVATDGPTTRSRVASTVSPDGKFMYAYGGSLSFSIESDASYFPELWRFDLVGHVWEKMSDSLDRFPTTLQGGILLFPNIEGLNRLWLLPYVAAGYSSSIISQRNTSRWHAYQYDVESGQWLDDAIPVGNNAPPFSLWYKATLIQNGTTVHAVITGGQIYPQNSFIVDTTIRFLQFEAAPLIAVEDTTNTEVDNNAKNTNNNNNDTTVIIIATVIPIAVIAALAIIIIIFIRRRSHSRRNNLLNQLEMNSSSSSNLQETSMISSITDVTLSNRIGGGNFGDVYKGLWQGTTPVACKMLKDSEQLKSFEQEASTLQKLRHPNVVQFFGIYSDKSSGKQYIVCEYLPQGSLSSFLAITKGISLRERLQMCKDAAAGMLYISEVHHLVHRDIALRNLLIVNKEGQHVVKISDLGLTRSTNAEGLYKSNDNSVPIKWTAPEALRYRVYNDKTDVWSLGIAMWEILSYGQTPYSELSNDQVLEKVTMGYRLPLPSEDTPTSVYQLLLQCWQLEPAERPTFKAIHDTILSLLSSIK